MYNLRFLFKFIKLVICILLFILGKDVLLLSATEKKITDIRVDYNGKIATFTFMLLQEGLIGVMQAVNNREEILWGLNYLSPGTYSIIISSKTLSASSSGFIEFYQVKYEQANVIGKRGSGELQFNNPQGICYDKINAEIYVADTGNDRVLRITKDGRQIAQYGGFGIAGFEGTDKFEDSLSSPWDVAVNTYSNLYISDFNNDRICHFDNYRKYKGLFFPTSKSNKFRNFKRPKGIFADTENNIWVIDSKNERIIKISQLGNELLEIGGYGLGIWNLSKPNQLFVDNFGQAYIADTNKGRIIVFNRFGKMIMEIKEGLKAPVSVTLDNDNLLYVGDIKQKNILVFDKTGKLVTKFDEQLNVPNLNKNRYLFKSPVDMLVVDDLIYILDSDNCNIAVYKKHKILEKYPWQLN